MTHAGASNKSLAKHFASYNKKQAKKSAERNKKNRIASGRGVSVKSRGSSSRNRTTSRRGSHRKRTIVVDFKRDSQGRVFDANLAKNKGRRGTRLRDLPSAKQTTTTTSTQRASVRTPVQGVPATTTGQQLSPTRTPHTQLSSAPVGFWDYARFGGGISVDPRAIKNKTMRLVTDAEGRVSGIIDTEKKQTIGFSGRGISKQEALKEEYARNKQKIQQEKAIAEAKKEKRRKTIRTIIHPVTAALESKRVKQFTSKHPYLEAKRKEALFTSKVTNTIGDELFKHTILKPAKGLFKASSPYQAYLIGRDIKQQGSFLQGLKTYGRRKQYKDTDIQDAAIMVGTLGYGAAESALARGMTAASRVGRGLLKTGVEGTFTYIGAKATKAAVENPTPENIGAGILGFTGALAGASGVATTLTRRPLARAKVALGMAEKGEFVGTSFEQHKPLAREAYFQKAEENYQKIINPRKKFSSYVRRVEPFSWQKPSTWMDKFKGRKPGQFKKWKNLNEDVIHRNIESQFAPPTEHLKIEGKQDIPVYRTSASSKFMGKAAKKGEITTIPFGSPEAIIHSETGAVAPGRIGVGGLEGGTFWAPPTTREILVEGRRFGTKGQAQSYLAYGMGSSESLFSALTKRKKLTLGKETPFIERGRRSLAPLEEKYKRSVLEKGSLSEAEYNVLSRETGYAPGEIHVGTASLAGKRSELEVIESAFTKKSVKKAKDIYFFDKGKVVRFKQFETKIMPMNKKEFLGAVDKSINYVEDRISLLEAEKKRSPELTNRINKVIEYDKEELAKLKNWRSELEETPYKQFPKYGGDDAVFRKRFDRPIKKQAETRELFEDIRKKHSSSKVSGSKMVSTTEASVIASFARASHSQSKIASGLSKSFSGFKGSGFSGGSDSGKSPIASSFSGFSGSSGFSSGSSGSSISGISGGSGVSRGLSSLASGLSKASPISKISLVPKSSKRKKEPVLFKSSKKKKKFFVEVRRRGRWERLALKSGAGEAIKFGKSIVGHSAAASFRILDAQSGLAANIGKNIGKDFYVSKKEKGVFIEKLGRRIKSGGELKEITMKGIRASKMKRGRWKW